MYLDDRTLLPSGMEIPGKQDTYIIERFLGLGLTAQVYRAQQVSTGRIVALKVLRHDTSQVSRDHFWHEAQVLNELHYAGVTYVPAVLAQQKTGDFQFLTLEYVDSEEYRPLDESLEPLLEQEALEVARQALEVLQSLHEKVGRTYTDMQLKNFRWNSATRTLKILDWNHVSTQRKFIQPDELRYFGVQTFEELAQRDLARWGAYFYRLLTGKGALEQGETVRALAQRAGEQWERISVAARQIVCRALHPDPSRRYTTAAEFLAAVKALQVCWCEEVDEGRERHKLDDLLDTIKEATSPEALKQLDEVAARLDLLERRGVVGLSILRRRLERLIQGTVSAAWGSGKLYYGAAQYLQATQIWEAEAAAQGRVDLWRWVLLARTGAQDAERFNRVREELESIIKALEQGAPESATWQQWKALVAREPWLTQEGVPVHWLGVEIQVAQQVAAGRAAEVEGDATQDPEAWNRAKAAFEDAVAALKTIPYGGLLCEIDDKQGLETKIEQLNEKILACSKDNERAETISQDFQAITEAENQGKKKQEVLIQLKLILITTPGAQKTLEVCETKAREWQEIDPKFALEIVETVLLYSHIVDRAAWMKLRREQLSKKLADLDRQIRAAVGAGKWEQARMLAAAWPPEGRFELYPELVTYVREVFNQQLQQSLWEAWQAHELLKALGAEGTETRLEEWRRAKEELQARSEEAKQLVVKLQAQAGELVQRFQMQQQQLEAAEQARQKVEQHNAKLQKFREWVDGLYTRWQALKTERGAEAYPDILREIETVSWSLEDPYQDLTNEEVYQKWRTYLGQQKAWLEEQIKADSDSQRNLEEAQSRFNEALEKAQELTSEALELAKVSLQQAQKALNYQPPVQHQKRHAQLLAQVQSLAELFDVINQKSLVLDVQKAKDLIKDCENLSGQDQGAFLSKFGICCELFGKVRAGLGALLWPQAKSYFPLLEAMEKQLAEWRRLYPLSGNGQSQEVVLTVSLAPEDLKKLQDALTTTKNTLIEHINNLKPEKRQEGPMTWLPWAFSGLALVLNTILLALFFPQMRQLQQVQRDLTRLSTPTQVASVPFVSATPASLTEAITVKPTETSMPTSTSTPTPTPTSTPTSTPTPIPTPMPPFTGVTLNWTRGITLYQMPALTLTAESGWTFTTTLTTPADSGNATLVKSGMDLNAEQTPWEIRVLVVNNQEPSMPLTGTLTVQDAQVAIWQPQKELSLLPGDYQVEILFLHDKEQQVLQGESLTIMPYYNVSAERSRVYDPGQPGMSVIYRITNTGNTTDTFKLVLYNAKPSAPIRGVSGTITLTSGLTKEIGIQGTAPSTQSFSITLPELAPGQAMDIDLFVNTESCPSMNLEFIPQNGKGTPLKKEEPFEGCR